MDALTAEECALIAQVIPVLLLVVAVGGGEWTRITRGVGDMWIVSAFMLICGVGESFAVVGAISGGVSSVWGVIFVVTAVFTAIVSATADLISRIWWPE